MSHKVKLHAPAGMAEMHIGDEVYAVDGSGRVEVAAHHAEDAKSLGASHAPIVEAGTEADAIAMLSQRVDALEAQVAELLKKRK